MIMKPAVRERKSLDMVGGTHHIDADDISLRLVDRERDVQRTCRRASIGRPC